MRAPGGGLDYGTGTQRRQHRDRPGGRDNIAVSRADRPNGMPNAKKTARILLRAAHRGWWVVALVVLWAQFVAAAHHHGEPGEAPAHRVAACDLCIAHGAPAAPPPAPVVVPVLQWSAPVRPVRVASHLPVLRDRPVPHAPRAPPSSRHA
jgi:hypothetical protein